ncbi:PrgI family protein [Patescibacteria group bacterium]|nr:PrgI family protein [Patescibacteria group bacterium]MBU4511643.1 PrgI family protein [Patescibacteria group bacterium]MCG2692713.1 PrgI family protein [Candidatus Parcubacteria bacterium]
MQQFTVPQFIERETQVIGKISVRQFLLLMVGGGFIFLSFKLSDLPLFFVQAIIIIGLTVLFAFVRINGQPFHYFLLNFLETLKRPNSRVWNKAKFGAQESAMVKESEDKDQTKDQKRRSKGPLSVSQLSRLSLIVDTGGAYREEE